MLLSFSIMSIFQLKWGCNIEKCVCFLPYYGLLGKIRRKVLKACFICHHWFFMKSEKFCAWPLSKKRCVLKANQCLAIYSMTCLPPPLTHDVLKLFSKQKCFPNIYPDVEYGPYITPLPQMRKINFLHFFKFVFPFWKHRI